MRHARESLQMHTEYWSTNLKGRDNFGVVGIRVKIIEWRVKKGFEGVD